MSGQRGGRPAWTPEDVETLRRAYSHTFARDLDLGGLATRLGRHKSNVCRKARSLGLTDLSRAEIPPDELRIKKARFTDAERAAFTSQRMKAWIKKNGHPRGATGIKHSAETRAVISAKSKAFWNRMSEEEKADLIYKKARSAAGNRATLARGTWKAGWREIGGQRCFFRSRWEANYARYLEWLKGIGQITKWEHEPHTFWFDGIKRGCVSYKPDFRVTTGDRHEWHEVKGWMDARSKTTLDRMGRYHPAEKLVVIRDREYTEIRNKVARLCDGWEESGRSGRA